MALATTLKNNIYKHISTSVLIQFVINMWSHVILVSQKTILLIDLTKQKHYVCVNVVSPIFSSYMADYVIMFVRMYESVRRCILYSIHLIES